jgi:hypothetical protein
MTGNIAIGELNRIAAAARDIFEQNSRNALDECLHDFPKGACGCVSELLGRYLQEYFGVAPLFVSAEVDNFATHAWLKINNTIIDITADQFGQPPIIVSNDPAWHRNLNCGPPTSLCPPSGWFSYPTKSWNVLLDGMRQRGFHDHPA